MTVGQHLLVYVPVEFGKEENSWTHAHNVYSKLFYKHIGYDNLLAYWKPLFLRWTLIFSN